MKILKSKKLLSVFVAITMIVLGLFLLSNVASANTENKEIPPIPGFKCFTWIYDNKANTNCDVWGREESSTTKLFNWKYSGSGDLEILKNGCKYNAGIADIEIMKYSSKDKKITIKVDCNNIDYRVWLISSTDPNLTPLWKDIEYYRGNETLIDALCPVSKKLFSDFGWVSTECEFDNIDLKTQNYDTILFGAYDVWANGDFANIQWEFVMNLPKEVWKKIDVTRVITHS